MTRLLPLYVAALALATAALYRADVVPRYAAVLVLAGGLLMFAVGSWRTMHRSSVYSSRYVDNGSENSRRAAHNYIADRGKTVVG